MNQKAEEIMETVTFLIVCKHAYTLITVVTHDNMTTEKSNEPS